MRELHHVCLAASQTVLFVAVNSEGGSASHLSRSKGQTVQGSNLKRMHPSTLRAFCPAGLEADYEAFQLSLVLLPPLPPRPHPTASISPSTSRL